MTIMSEKTISFNGSGLTKVVAEIAVSTCDQIPAVNGISGRILCQGSIVHAIRDGIVAKLDEDGKWYDINGEIVSE